MAQVMEPEIGATSEIPTPESTPGPALGIAQQTAGQFAPQMPYARRNMREVYISLSRQQRAVRFETMDAMPPFILDTSGSQPLFQYEQGGEVLVLKPVHTTRGDTIYKNDQGIVVLRVRRVGSATVFPQHRSQGIMAWSTGQARQVGPPQVSLLRMKAIMGQIADDLANTLNHDLSISISGATQQTAWLFLDAAFNVRDGIRQTLSLAPEAAPLPGIISMQISVAEQPASIIEDGVLKLYVTPARGFAGRLSSLQIQTSLMGEQVTGRPMALPVLASQQETSMRLSESSPPERQAYPGPSD